MKKLTATQYARILHQTTEGLDEKTTTSVISLFVELLHKHRALRKVADIVRSFELIAKKASGVKQLSVTSARELSKETKKGITKRFGETSEITSAVDESLIGGIIVRDENIIFDASVSGQLSKLEKQLSL